MATAKRTVQKPGAASTTPAPVTTTEENTNTAAQTDAAPAQATTPNALTQPIAAGSLLSAPTDAGGAYLPEQLANDERSELERLRAENLKVRVVQLNAVELERLRAENLALKQQQAAAPVTATQVTGPAPVPPAPERTTHAGGGVLTEHGWLI